MAAARAGDASAGGLAASAAAPTPSRLVDACLLALLAAIPLIAPSADRASVVLLAGTAGLGAWALYQKASRAQRLSRCVWTVFLAVAVAIHLGLRGFDPPRGAAGIPFPGALATGLAAGLALAGKLGLLAWERRRPRLADTHDRAAVVCVAILAVGAGAFHFAGRPRGAGALAEPAVIAAMVLVVRGQFGALGKARRLAQLATASAIVSLAVWGVTR